MSGKGSPAFMKQSYPEPVEYIPIHRSPFPEHPI